MIARTSHDDDFASPRLSFLCAASAGVRLATLLIALLLVRAAPAVAQTVSCATETSGSATNYVCTITDCTSFDLNTLNGLVGADADSVIWIRAWGGEGGKGNGVAAADGGEGGSGGYAQTVTTVNDYYGTFGTTLIYFYLGEMGNEQHDGGLGGSSTIVAAADLTVAAPCISACGSANIVLIAGGGGGGGQASSDGFYAGGHGGDGGSAFAAQGSAGLGTGGASAGNYQGENSAGGGGNGQAGSDAGSSGDGHSQSGIGGYGGEVHISSGGSAPQGWSNQTPTQVGTMGQGGEGGHDDAAGGGGGGGYGGGGGGGSGSSLQGTGGGGGGSYAVASSQPTSSAPTSRPSSPSSAGVLQIVYQQIARTPLAPPTSTATLPPTTTPVITLAVGEVSSGSTPTPTVAASPSATSAGTATATPQPFADNDDILNGQRVLADVVDLIVVNPQSSGQSTQMQNVVLETADGGVVPPQVVSDVASAPCVQDTTPFGSPFPQQARAGRLFNTIEDVIVSLGPNAQSDAGTCGDATDMSLYVADLLVPSNGSTTVVGPVTTGNLMMAIADFNLDGFDDVLVINELSAFTATALDTDTPSAGLSVGPSVLLSSTAMSPLAEPATGDFNADGLIDVAWIGGDYDGGPTDASVYFATVCPGPVPNTVCATSASFDILLMPLSAAAIALPNPNTYCGGFAANAITTGNFSGDVSVGIPNQLMTITINDRCLPAAQIFDFDGNMAATALTAATELPGVAGASLQVSATYATSAVLDVLSAATQAVVAYGGPSVDGDGDVSTAQNVAVVSYDGLSSLAVVAASTSTESLAPLAGLAVGVFGAPPETDPTTQDYTPSIAMLLGAGCGGESPSVQIYTVDDDTLAPGLTSTVELSGVALPTAVGYINLAGSLLQAGDLQGESIRVGQPVLVEVTSSSQPYIVLGAPPMHADYVALDDDTPDVVNFSVLPGNYYSQYNTMVIGSNQSSTQSTTSYGHAIDVSATEQAGYAFTPAFEANTTLTQSVQLTYDRTTAKQYDSFAEVDFDASTQTNFYDQVWYTMQSYTLYNYPVIGQTSCPADSPSATSCDPTYPLYITLSGPTVDTQVTVQGSTLEWFQPVHEIGQVFSYPPNETLLEERLDDPSEPLSSAVSFDTDTSSSEESVSWSISQSLDLTAGSSSTFSFATDNSVTAGTPLYSILDEGVQVSVSGDYSTTTSQSTLNSQTTMVGASGGLEIVKSGQFLNPSLYAYQVEPFIFGETEPVSPDQTIALDTDIQTTGTLQTAFAADVTTGSGAWWVGSTPYSTYPDLALNHPARWTYEVENRTNPPSACLQQTEVAADGYLCMTANDPDPDDLWDSEFYWMRGLLITVGGATGTQRNTAVVGDDVYLQARLYNYSLTEMAAGTEVHVQFYMQQWDDLTKAPLDDAILINGTDSVLSGGIPPFNEETPNWTTVTTSFSTDDLPGDTVWVFWVVAWMEDGDGNLVDELPGHGLTAVPGVLTSIADVPIESVTVTLPDGSKDDDASFTNNVGFYNVEFALQSADTAAAALRAQAQGVAAPPQPDDLNASLSSSRAATGEKITVSGLIHSPGGLPDGAFVYFYDGAPTGGAQPFDIELIPPVRPGDSGLARVPYRARTCGLHPITIVASRGRANQVAATAMLDVPCGDVTPTVTPDRPTPTATPRATPAGHEDDGCAVVRPLHPGAVVLLLPVLAALAWRRRARRR